MEVTPETLTLIYKLVGASSLFFMTLKIGFAEIKKLKGEVDILKKEFVRLDKDVYLKLLELSKDITYIRKEIDAKK